MKSRNTCIALAVTSLLATTSVVQADDDTGFYAAILANWISADFDNSDDISPSSALRRPR